MADQKLSQLTAETSPSDTDLLYTASGGGPTSKSIALSTLKAYYLNTPAITGNTTIQGGFLSIGGDGTNAGALMLKPASAAYNCYTWVNMETGSNQGIALQKGAYPSVTSTPLTIDVNGAMATPAGTVSPLGYTLTGTTPIPTPADATTYFFGSSGYNGSTSQGFYRFWIPRGGTVKKVYFENTYSGTQPTSETSTLNMRVNSGSNIVMDTGFHNETNLATRITTCSVSVSAGDYIEFNWVTPTWATNPGTSSMIRTTVYVE